MSVSYTDFLASKQRRAGEHGREIDPAEVHSFLHPFQHEIVRWAVRTGRCGMFTTTGTGKTAMQLQYAKLSGATSLIVAPLAVCQQTVREAERKLDMQVQYVRSGGQITEPGVWITNFEMVPAFDPREIDAVVLDEGAILRNSVGKTRTMLIRHFAPVPRRMTCTATPRPNDAEELTNQAEFVGASTRVDMLASYFIHDDSGWRLKGHARAPLFQWMASWAYALRRPSDMGHSDEGYDLPGLEIIPEFLPVDIAVDGQLFPTDLGGVSGRATIRRLTLDARCNRAAELVEREVDEPWLLWCGMNDEASTLARLIPGAINVHGAMSPEEKAEYLLGFADGEFNVLITKPSIAAQGLNYQHCARMAFVGLSDSYDSYFQSIRRCYRYGQSRVVHAHIVLSELESQIAGNVARKEREADQFMAELVEAMQSHREAV